MQEQQLKNAFERFRAGDLAGVERECAAVLQAAPGQVDALHLLGMARLMGGRTDEAVELIGRAHAGRPQDVSVLENLGLAYLVKGANGEAETTLRRALAAGSAHGLTHMRLGLALAAQGKLAESVNCMQTAAQKLPGDPDVLLNLGNALCQTGKLDDARGCYEKVLAAQPANVDAYFNLGTVYRQMGRLAEAEAAYRQVLARIPDHAEVYNNLGLVQADGGRNEEAERSYRRALELAPNMAQAHNNLGNVLLAQGRRAEAVACYEKAIALDPAHPDAYVNLGSLRAEEGDIPAAQRHYEKALLLAPTNFDAHRGLGGLEQVQGRRQQALAHFRKAFEANPGYADSCSDLGRAYRDLGDFAEAANWFNKAIAIDSGHVHSHFDLAETLKLIGRFDEAVTSYERVLALQPDYYPALSGLIYMRQLICAWDGIEALWDRLCREAIGRPNSGVTPFSVLSQPTTPEEQLACAKAWAAQQAAPLARQAPGLGFDFAGRKPHERLRIGYLSWDFHKHATSYLIAELFELQDRSRFEIFAYSMGPDDGSEIRQRIRTACDHFVDVAADSDIGAAQKIYADEIDVLVDLKGYTLGARTPIMALRPAPVQVNWLGFPGSMGADFIDWIVADPFVIPQGSELHYSEQVLRLPGCYQINDRHRVVGSTPDRRAAGLPETGLVFCCFNVNHKILPEMFERWMRILQAVPGSVLWLLEANRWAAENLRGVAARHGIAPERIVFAPMLPLAEHLARYRLADLALDTFPYTSHTTGSDALWAGCPLVTCAGATFASRVAGSLLINAGLPELVTESFDAFEQLAITLARDPARLAALRARLQANRDTCILFDTPRFVRDFENAMLHAWSARAH